MEQENRPGAADSQDRRRLLIVSANFPPANTPGVHRVVRFAKHLHESGWTVHVLTIKPSHFRNTVRVDDALRQHVPAGVTVHATKVLRGIQSLVALKNRLQRLFKPRSENSVGNDTGTHPVVHETGAWRKLKDKIVGMFSFPDPDVGWYWYAVSRGKKLVRKYSYDEACEVLARHFLGDKLSDGSHTRETLVQDLSQHIQDEVESWIRDQIDERQEKLLA